MNSVRTLVFLGALTLLIAGCGEKTKGDGPGSETPTPDVTAGGTDSAVTPPTPDAASAPDTGPDEPVTGELPLFDAHAHAVPDWDPSTLPGLVDDHGVLGMAVLGTMNIANLQANRPDEFMGFFFVEKADDVDLNAIKGALNNGARGIGELSARHFAAGPGASAVTDGMDHPTLMDVYEVAAEFQVPVNVHCDYEDTLDGEMDAAISANPDTTFVWAHAGDTTPEFIEPLLEAYDNLLIDISCRNDLEPFTTRPFPLEDQRITEDDGTLQDRWRQLFEDYPDQVMFGSDIGPPGRLEIYGEILTYFRAALGQLEPNVAQKIAYKNAQALFGLE